MEILNPAAQHFAVGLLVGVFVTWLAICVLVDMCFRRDE